MSDFHNEELILENMVSELTEEGRQKYDDAYKGIITLLQEYGYEGVLAFSTVALKL